jgi:hypothetical protein
MGGGVSAVALSKDDELWGGGVFTARGCGSCFVGAAAAHAAVGSDCDASFPLFLSHVRILMWQHV